MDGHDVPAHVPVSVDTQGPPLVDDVAEACRRLGRWVRGYAATDAQLLAAWPEQQLLWPALEELATTATSSIVHVQELVDELLTPDQADQVLEETLDMLELLRARHAQVSANNPANGLVAAITLEVAAVHLADEVPSLGPERPAAWRRPMAELYDLSAATARDPELLEFVCALLPTWAGPPGELVATARMLGVGALTAEPIR